MTPEAPVVCALSGALSCAQKLHGSVDQESIGEGFQLKFAGFFGATVIGLDAIGPERDERATHCAQTDVGGGLVSMEIAAGKISFDVPVRGDQASGRRQEKSIPFEVRNFERREIELLLVLQASLHASPNQTLGRLVCRLCGFSVLRRRMR